VCLSHQKEPPGRAGTKARAVSVRPWPREVHPHETSGERDQAEASLLGHQRSRPDATPDQAPLPEASTHRRDISPAQARAWLGSVPCSHVRGAARSSASGPDGARASRSMPPTAGSRPSMLSRVSYSSTSFANLRNFRRSYFRWSSVGVGAE